MNSGQVSRNYAAIYVKSKHYAYPSKAKELISRIFTETETPEIVNVASPDDIESAINRIKGIIKDREETIQGWFLVIDLFLSDSDTLDLKRLHEEQIMFGWDPDDKEIDQLFKCYCGLRNNGTYNFRFSEKSLTSFQIFKRISPAKKSGIVVIFDCSNTKISKPYLAKIYAKLYGEGIVWLYTDYDEEQNGKQFMNFLKMLLRGIHLHG